MILPKKREAPLARVARYSESEIPTARGALRVVVYRELVDGQPHAEREHVALVVGRPHTRPGPVLARVHSECLTSEVFGSLKCDCKDQLEHALDRCHEAGHGVVLYLRQEGRGIGLGNKIRAYALQESGADTVQANHQLGFATDLRRYDMAAEMLLDLGVGSISLMTNNPDKLSQLRSHGIQVEQRVPIVCSPNEHSQDYLVVKREKCGHLIELDPPDDR
jgi:GTP cyclohydrolase II/3,4-dihydroxy 2-butanone 4-phosphate synthase/GTP cyclohydrolase II